MLLYPFVSVQKNFGYSDVTDLHNMQEDKVSQMFARSQQRLFFIQRAFFIRVKKQPVA